MNTIVDFDSRVRRVLGRPKIKSTKYRLMRYIIQQPVDDGILLLNVLSGQLIWLSNKEKEIIQQLPAEYDQEMNELINDFFLVPIQYDEYQVVLQVRKILSYIYSTEGINRYTILPTTGCNARCYYCFESGIKPISMNDETAQKVISFIDNKRNPNEKVHIEWFGGEPLVGYKSIDYICAGLKTRNIDFVCSMITNGYLFSEEMCKKAVAKWNLTKVQITLDGTEQRYNATKAYVGNLENPYAQVIRNIEFLLCNKIFVSIRLNLSEHNEEDLYQLIQELNSRFSDYKEWLSVYVSPLFGDGKTDRRNLFETAWKLDEQIVAKELHKPYTGLLTLNFKGCKIESDNSMTIYPDGRLLKCAVAAGEHFVGDLDNGITDRKVLNRLCERLVRTECEYCPIMPECIKPSICTLRNTCISYYLNHRIDICKNSMIQKWTSYMFTGNLIDTNI